MDEAAKKSRAERITATILANCQRRRYCDAFVDLFPGQHDPDEVLAELQLVLDGADDQMRLRCCLFDAAAEYVRKSRQGGATNFMPPVMFIRYAAWRSENLEFNRQAA
jgi:hypothetical protein